MFALHTRGMDRLATPLLLMFASLGAGATQTLAQPQWQRHFDARGVQGTFVLLDPAQDRYLVYDEARAKRGYLPASTFKVANALIGLEVGSIADEHEVFKWDGKPKAREEWERDQTLASGMRESTVWMFQEVARRTGKARMKEWLAKLDYGNRDMRGGIDLFWLQGNLRISAMQQVELLHKLAEGRLPMTQRSQRLVREAMVVEKTREHTVYAKTGSTGWTRPGAIHWWVGWVERRGKPVGYFAMNLTTVDGTKFGDRFEIARAILREAAVLP
jgi:beta-lactamase class D